MRLKRGSTRRSWRAPKPPVGVWWVLALLAVAGGVTTRDIWLMWWRGETFAPESTDLQDAQRAFAVGDLTASVNISARRYASHPDDWNALTLLVRSLIYRSYVDFQHEGDRAEALKLTTQATMRNNPSAPVLAIHALALQANRRAEEAVRTALRAIDRDRENVVARLALALGYSSSGLFEAGLREAERAVGIAQASASDWRWDALRAKAITLSDLGRYQDALNTVEEALTVNRRLIPAHFEKALYALQLAQGDAAAAAYFNVLAFDSQNVKARFRLCELSSSVRERDNAIRYCGEVTERRPDWAEGWYRLGREHFLNGNFRQAQQALSRCSALQIAQGVPIVERRLECWYLQGQAAEIVGDCEGLLGAYNEFLTMAVIGNLPQTWLYPPEGPAICLTPVGSSS